MSLKFGAAALAALSLCAGAAQAGIVKQRITISATDFTAFFGPPAAPVDPFQAVFDVTYDNAASLEPTADGIVVRSLNFPANATLFSYSKPFNQLVIGTHPTPGGAGGFAIQTFGDYGLEFAPVTTNPFFEVVQYFSSNGGDYVSFKADITVASIPEPSAWAMLVLGAGLAGSALRRRTGSQRPWARSA